MNRPFVIGITGGIGSGKSTVCQIFEQLGVPVYYADDRGKLLMHQDLNLKKQVVAEFGDESYFSNGALNRTYLAGRVFNDPIELEKLNKLVHPAVAKDFVKWAESQKTPFVLKEAALLIENDSYKQLDRLVCVMASEKVRTERVLLRDSQRSAQQVADIMSRQVDDKARKAAADFLIDNSGEKLLIPQVIKLYQQFERLGKEI